MRKNDATSVVLPVWADRIRQLYLAGEANVFIVHGNVQDYVLNGEKLTPMLDFIGLWMESTKKSVYEWSVYKGLTKRDSKEQIGGDTMLEKLKRLDIIVRNTSENACLVFPHASALIPSGDPQFRSGEERMLLSALLDWSMDEKIASGNNLVLLLAESTMDLPSELLANPRIATVQIGLPDEAARMAVIGIASSRSDQGVARIAQQTAGLKLVQIHSLFGKNKKGLSVEQREELVRSILVAQGALGEALEERVKKMGDITGGMTPDEISHLLGGSHSYKNADEEMLAALMIRKRALIEKECSGLIEFMDTRHGLDAVGGNENIKHELMAIAKTIKAGDKRLSPMGLLAVGAMGSGKTFVIRAFLKEAGLTGLTLKNFRSKWVGSTESNLERVLATVRAMGPVALVIDESDRSFGNGEGGDSDGGTSSRIIARLKEFMSDTENRGQVLFIMLTNRPDKLDTDIKRPGRLDRKIPFFYAETVEDLRAIATVLCKRYHVSAEPLQNNDVVLGMTDYSNADIEALVGLYANNVQLFPDGDVSQLFAQALDDFIPPREGDMIHYMNLLAVKEASRKSLVPQKYHSFYEGANLSAALAEAKRALY